MKVELKKTNGVMIATWVSPEGPFALAWLSGLQPEDYDEEPHLMDHLKQQILDAYREAARAGTLRPMTETPTQPAPPPTPEPAPAPPQPAPSPTQPQ